MSNRYGLPDEYSREGLHFEAKSAASGIPGDFWETYSAFANTFGGTIVLGLSEDENHDLYVSGIDDPMSLVKTLWDNLNNPRVTNYNLLKNDDITIEDCCGKSIVVVNVPAAERQKRPIYVKNSINSGTFKRNHEGDYHCRMDEIREMIRESEDQSFDSTPVPSLGIDCFDMDTVARYLNEVSAHRPGHPWLRVSLDEFLSMSGATTLEQDGVHPTEAGLLMFGKVSCIRRVFNHYFLDYRESFGDDRWDYRIHSNSGEWSGNIYDFVSLVMNRLSLRIGSRFSLEGFVNTDGSDIRLPVREALVNGVIHADYRVPGAVSVIVTKDHITVTNPGTMRVDIDRARKGGFSDPRNNTLMALAMSVGWVERIGSGIYMMERAVSKGDLSSVDISEYTDPSSTKVVLGTTIRSARNDVRESKVLDMIRADPHVTRAEIADSLGISQSTVGTVLSRLKSDGIIVRVGSNKNGKWLVLED